MALNKTKNYFEVSVRFETRNVGGCYYGYFREEKLDYFHTMICDKFINKFTCLCANQGINIVKSEKYLEDNLDIKFGYDGLRKTVNNLSLHRYWLVGFFIFHLEDKVLVDTEKINYLLHESTTNKFRVDFDTGKVKTGIKDVTRLVNTYEVLSSIKKVDYFLKNPNSFYSVEDRLRRGSLKAIKEELGRYTKSDNNFIKSVDIDTPLSKFDGIEWGKSYTIVLRSKDICFSSKYHMILEKSGVPPVYCDSGFLLFFLKYCYNKKSSLKDSDLDFFSERYGVNVWKSAEKLNDFISKRYKAILTSLLAYYLQVRDFTIQVTYDMVDPDNIGISVNMLENFGNY